MDVDLAALEWRKSSSSVDQGCVEIAVHGAHVMVRDSKSPSATVLGVNRRQWLEFLDAVRTDEWQLSR
ncbi:DUF397 domain-containing protein [Cryptosporangium sp. NPDC051539]|uniref:DUF397 domain-containing protein n=1 Tax=Cryptosporangium sp. NPDC051539 TaxID=3363962 RepID=UPI0037B67745